MDNFAFEVFYINKNLHSWEAKGPLTLKFKNVMRDPKLVKKYSKLQNQLLSIPSSRFKTMNIKGSRAFLTT